jgi:hypothetical protein
MALPGPLLRGVDLFGESRDHLVQAELSALATERVEASLAELLNQNGLGSVHELSVPLGQPFVPALVGCAELDGRLIESSKGRERGGRGDERLASHEAEAGPSVSLDCVSCQFKCKRAVAFVESFG